MTTDDARLINVLFEARKRGFLGPGPVEPHIAHARGFVQAMHAHAEAHGLADELAANAAAGFADLGSGGGVPGLVIALDEQWTGLLVDGKAKRASWLAEAIEWLRIEGQADAICAEGQVVAHDLERRGTFGLVVARGFGPPSMTAEIAAGLLRVGGWMVVSEPPEDDDRWSGLVDAGFGFEAAERHQIDGAGGFVVARLASQAPDSVPRRSAALRTRPRF